MKIYTLDRLDQMESGQERIKNEHIKFWDPIKYAVRVPSIERELEYHPPGTYYVVTYDENRVVAKREKWRRTETESLKLEDLSEDFIETISVEQIKTKVKKK